MNSRRKFLSWLGTGLLVAPVIRAEVDAPRRSRWDLMFHDEPPSIPGLHPDPRSWDDTTITAAWIGHATVLINLFGTRIITDPVFSERIGLDVMGLFTLGPKRLVLPALKPEDLPPIDIILVSHAHMDHLDTPSIRQFERNIPIVMAKNTVDVIEPMGFERVYELDWGQHCVIGDVRIEAMEVKHFGWRYPWEDDRSRGNPDGRSYNAYLISRNGRHILFGGDTAYQENFRVLRERRVPIDLAILPIGAYNPWIRNHATPEQALAMADHMEARYLLPIHWNTFIQSDEPTAEPMARLKSATALRPERIVLDTIGQTWAMGSDTASG